ncbi:MAG: hypothetical protein HFF17_01510 [Oscillospiraceae bacterium]|nr:hypothetical protein [Oscillospiraceae bacterium]
MNETPDRREEAPEETPRKPAPDPRRESMRRVIMLIAGGYLIYLGVQLAMMVYNGTAEGSGRIVSLIAAVLFIPCGAVTLVLNLRTVFQSFRDSIAAMPDYDEEDGKTDGAEAAEEAPRAIEAPAGEEEAE